MATSDPLGSEEAAKMVEPGVRENSMRSDAENKTDISPFNDLHSHRDDPVKEAENSESQIDADPESLEEGELTWESCTCSKASCLSCRAEKVAIMTWSKPSDTQTVSQSTESPVGQKSKRRSTYFTSTTTDTSAPVFAFQFPTDLSDTTLDGHHCAASPCALANLLFAKAFADAPDDLLDTEVSDKLYWQVVNNIARAIDIHWEAFEKDPVILLAADACALLQSLQCGLYEPVASKDCLGFEAMLNTVIEYMFQLQPLHCVLITTTAPYRAIVLVRARGEEGVLLFSSQPYFKYDLPQYKGAWLMYSKKDRHTLTLLRIPLAVYAGLHMKDVYTITMIKL